MPVVELCPRICSALIHRGFLNENQKEETIVRPAGFAVKSFLDGRTARRYSCEEAQAPQSS